MSMFFDYDPCCEATVLVAQEMARVLETQVPAANSAAKMHVGACACACACCLPPKPEAVIPRLAGSTTTTNEAAAADDDVRIDMAAMVDENANATEDESTTTRPAQVVHALWVVGLLTLSMDVSTALYKPARGVVFARSTLAYYLTLAAIFCSGLAELLTAFWLQSAAASLQDDGDDGSASSRFTVGRVVLCASVVPFVAILAIGGFAFIDAA